MARIIRIALTLVALTLVATVKPTMAWFEQQEIFPLDDRTKIVAVHGDTLYLQGNTKYDTHEGIQNFRGFCQIIVSRQDSVEILNFSVSMLEEDNVRDLPYKPAGFDSDWRVRKNMYTQFVDFLRVIGHDVKDTSSNWQFSFSYAGTDPEESFTLPRM